MERLLCFRSFAERLRRLGDEFDQEVRQALEAALQRGASEVKLLREEVDWLQSQLAAERQQSTARLSSCTELKQRLQEAEQMQRFELEAKEFWQAEFSVKEEQYSLLEAKLAALALTEEEAEADALRKSCEELEAPAKLPTAMPEEVQATRAGCEVLCEEADADVQQEIEAERDDTEEELDLSDARSVQSCLESLEAASSSKAEQMLSNLRAEGFHALLMAALSREGSGPLLHRIIRVWVCRLLNRQEGLAMKKAAELGNVQALEALVSLGGTAAVAKATASSDNGQDASAPLTRPPERSAETGLLALCAVRGDCESLALLLEHLRGSRKSLELISEARVLAEQHGRAEAAGLLATHLVVELSYVGNARYRSGEYETAIACYHEAIELCEVHPEGTSSDGANRDNLIRLRYNLARALHRSDRWAEARDEATAVLAIDREYMNAYALRAQAAMSALEWDAAKADWDKLALLAERGGSASVGAEVLRAWRRRKEECCRQLAQDHYDALGLPRLASQEEVRKAYRELAKRWHPDKHQSRGADLRQRAARRFQRIRQAYEVLSDEALKHAYDTELLLLEAPRQARPTASMSSRRGSFSDIFVDGL
ncbi:unnamed protein product [Effrenium voratum]|uniref:J domain-containing protein n=1 Tax=Effrenium voratum TaxID=2562239 RepID=A0AA36J7G9_9DINO|nr:unnamed protein product [Effrenium voratum]CAJ1448522.1 unnamed protein product [Effrenium voratum]